MGMRVDKSRHHQMWSVIDLRNVSCVRCQIGVLTYVLNEAISDDQPRSNFCVIEVFPSRCAARLGQK